MKVFLYFISLDYPMGESFALKGALRYLLEEYEKEEIEEVHIICEDLAFQLSKKRGYLHPRALAAAASHTHKSRKGVSITLEATSVKFGISTATLREYLRASPSEGNALEASKNLIKEKTYGADMPKALEAAEELHARMKGKRTTLNSAALAASSVYLTYYKDGRDVSLTDISRDFGISTSTLRDYLGNNEFGMDHIQRAKTMLLKELQPSHEESAELMEIVDKLSKNKHISTSRILAGMAYYLFKIENHEYTTIEKVARAFNVSVPALRSYLEPYFASISTAYLLFKEGRKQNVEAAVAQLNERDMEMLNEVYKNFDMKVFDMSLLFDMSNIPRGRWQLFLRKLARLGLMDVYKKPLDPKQYCALIPALRDYLSKPEKLDKWV
jgi:lambda repressor-like predicted transcriptional regulator